MDEKEAAVERVEVSGRGGHRCWVMGPELCSRKMGKEDVKVDFEGGARGGNAIGRREGRETSVSTTWTQFVYLCRLRYMS